MNNGYLRYFIGFLVVLGLIIVVIALLFRGGGGTKTNAPTPKALSSYSTTDAVARMTISGPVSSPQTHNQLQVTVGRDTTTYQQFLGYDGNVISSQSFPNTETSYNVFLHALAHAGYTLGVTDPKLSNSAGYCPLGRVYTFELVQDGKSLINFWDTSCGSTKTYGGNLNLTLALFQAQVPNYDTLTNNLNL